MRFTASEKMEIIHLVEHSQWSVLIDLAVDIPELSCRELACRYTDEYQYFISESSVYRILKTAGLVSSPHFDLIQAADKFKNVKKYFRHKVRLIYNDSKDDYIILGLNAASLGLQYTRSQDLKEAAIDFAWGIAAAGGSFMSEIGNPATLQMLAILQVGKDKNIPLGIVASSQGSLISFNAILAFKILENENADYLKKMVRVCHTGEIRDIFYALP